MLNWKLEEYEAGDKVCIINKIGIYNTKEVIIEGEVIYSDDTLLKVVISFEEDSEKTLDFDDRRICNDSSFGNYYLVYKTIEEYNQTVIEKEKIENLKVYITRNLNDMPLDILKNIAELIDTYRMNS